MWCGTFLSTRMPSHSLHIIVALRDCQHWWLPMYRVWHKCMSLISLGSCFFTSVTLERFLEASRRALQQQRCGVRFAFWSKQSVNQTCYCGHLGMSADLANCLPLCEIQFSVQTASGPLTCTGEWVAAFHQNKWFHGSTLLQRDEDVAGCADSPDEMHHTSNQKKFVPYLIGFAFSIPVSCFDTPSSQWIKNALPTDDCSYLFVSHLLWCHGCKSTTFCRHDSRFRKFAPHSVPTHVNEISLLDWNHACKQKNKKFKKWIRNSCSVKIHIKSQIATTSVACSDWIDSSQGNRTFGEIVYVVLCQIENFKDKNIGSSVYLRSH